jgi:hypothetical protein
VKKSADFTDTGHRGRFAKVHKPVTSALVGRLAEVRIEAEPFGDAL